MFCLVLSVPLLSILFTQVFAGHGPHPDCFSNGTMLFEHPDTGLFTHVVAVLYEGTSSAEDCSTSISGNSVWVSSCDFLDSREDVIVHFSDRSSAATLDSIFGGSSVLTYRLSCYQIPSVGVSRLVTDGLTISMEATSESSITPSFVVSMAIRGPGGATDSVVSHARVGNELTWTIDVPDDYYARPSCRALPKYSSSINKQLYAQGCAVDLDLVDPTFDNSITSIPHVRRYYTSFHAFKFYSTDNVFLKCIVLVCPNPIACTTSCTKKRSVDDWDSLAPGLQRFTVSKVLQIQGTESHATTVLGSVWILVGALLITIR